MISQTPRNGLLRQVTTFTLEYDPDKEQSELDTEIEYEKQVKTEVCISYFLKEDLAKKSSKTLIKKMIH